MEEDKLENSVDDQELDEVFEILKKEIEIKHISENVRRVSAEENSGYTCKVCGTLVNRNHTKNCVHCGLSICKKCSSYGFCLNCWVNMKDDPRRTLKLTRTLAYMLPIITIAVLMQGICWYLITEGVLVGITLLMYRYAKYHILKHPNRFFALEWENEIQTEEFSSFLNPVDGRRYISNEVYRELDKKKARSVVKLENWLESITGFNDTPKPFVEDEPETLVEEMSIEDSFKTNENATAKGDNTKDNMIYNLIDKACPQCNKIVQFADFCPHCNIKYCPKCKTANNPYTKTCICGCVFPDLREEYFIWTGKRNIEWIDKDLKDN
ncbi:MAG: hypothetical protein ACTSWW_05650 [Promethearchaeota archaeon]